jgi:GDP-mannose 6-dehydrogenase
VIGSGDDRAAEVLAGLYADIDAELVTVPVKVAEMVKYASNAFHALKVTFGNEIGNICAAQGIDSHHVMEIFSKDTKLNISAAYLRPGFAFGGSCLPKDLRALVYQSRVLDVRSPVLESILPSNELQVEKALRLVLDTPFKRVGVLGMSFKAGTDDLRESPIVELIERLIGKGYQVGVFDENVALAALQGANKAFIETEIPHISSLMHDSVDSLLETSELLIIGNGDPRFRRVAEDSTDDHHIIDLVRIVDSQSDGDRYTGISW